MNTNDALNLLNLPTGSNQAEIKKAFKKQSLKFHPDRNVAGEQMMIAINAAYEHLKVQGETVNGSDDFDSNDYSEKLNEALKNLLELEGLTIEICGNWVWVTGDTKPHSKRLGRKEGGIGCFYASKKKAWYFRPEEYKSYNRKTKSMDEIRSSYGSTQAFKTPQRRIA